MFTKHSLPLKETGLFQGLFNDYISEQPSIRSLYGFHINREAYQSFLDTNPYESLDRNTLVKSLETQAATVTNTSDLSLQNIRKLNDATAYTVTTGHQLCLFTGPLYFIYKIISTINLGKALQQAFPDKTFVPVYWMASEDHDFEEINHVHVFGKKLSWNNPQKGSVGEFSTDGIQDVISELKTVLGESANSTALIQLFEKSYTEHRTLAQATRYLVNELFGKYGLVILDGNDAELKSVFKAEFKSDIFESKSVAAVNETIQTLKDKNYSIQVNPRDINVFYKDANLRERIELSNGQYKVLNTGLSFSKEELTDLIENEPEKLSPNVVLRPLYQQKILPNIAYVGGPGEIAYWLEYKALFESYQITFPVLMPRNFVLFIDKATITKLQKLNLKPEDVFMDGEELVKNLIKTQHADVSLEESKNSLSDVYQSIVNTITAIDKSLIGATEAEKQKALNGIQNIEQKINRALKQKSETDINQIWSVKQKLFPNQVPQERYDNFSMYVAKYGEAFINGLFEQLTYSLETFEYNVLLEN